MKNIQIYMKNIQIYTKNKIVAINYITYFFIFNFYEYIYIERAWNKNYNIFKQIFNVLNKLM